MAEMKYLDFDLHIERSGERYKALVLNSPAGQAEGDFCLPFSELEVENFLLKVGRPLRQVRRVETPEIEATKSFGGRLFEAVFSNEVRACLRSSLDDAERQGVGLRLRLRMTNAPELTDLPWEYLYNPSLNRFLSLAKETPIVRYLELPQRVRPIEVIPPLRVLVMISSPYNYPKLDVEREWAKLKNVLSPLEQQDLVALERLDKATLSMLQRMLRQKEYHIFHFIGHGGFDKQSQDGVLILEEDEDERGRAVSGQYLGTLLHNHHPLRLAILNACEGGRTSRTDPFAGTAQSLVQQGIPAVIAMQFEITDEAAITFAQEFYTALTDSYPVDAALVEARTAIFAHGNNVEWGTPVLYMRSPDGQIFNIANIEKKVSPLPGVSTSTKELPLELLQAIAHPIPEVREGTVKVLEDLLHGVHKELVQRAEAALKKLAEDDSRKVAAAAKACLARYAATTIISVAVATDVDGMITIDERGVIERFNDAAARIFGYSAEEVLRKSVSLLMPSPYRELHDNYIANYLKTGEKKIIGIRREVYGQRKDGATFPMDIAVNEVFDGNRRTFTAIIQDISARKQAEEQLQKTKATVEAAQKAAQYAAPKPAVTERPKSPKVLWMGIAAVAVIAIVVVLFVFKKPASNLSNSARVGQPTTKAPPDTAKISEPTPTQPTAPQSEVNQQKPAGATASKESGAKKKSEEATAGGSKKESERRVEEQNAAAARDEMQKAKQSVPGSEKDNNAKYRQAENLAAAGESQIQAGDFSAAQSSFEQAIGFYVRAAEEMTSMLKRTADAARASMREAKDKIEKDSYTEDKFQQAISIETEADKAYRENDFDKAAALYKKAQELYATAASEAAEKREVKRKETAQREIQSLISGFEHMFENKKQQVLETSFKEPKDLWSDFFKYAEKINVTIVNQKSQINNNNTQVILTFYIEYEQRGVKNNTPEFKRIWTLQEQGDKWLIVSMQE